MASPSLRNNDRVRLLVGPVIFMARSAGGRLSPPAAGVHSLRRAAARPLLLHSLRLAAARCCIRCALAADARAARKNTKRPCPKIGPFGCDIYLIKKERSKGGLLRPSDNINYIRLHF
ncbi:hypothetical protein [Aminicella lysinilytica]|uniref:hypothetical protein n=1 Tax=Aminicella lysinilytica TaxID=433323 RepID=UPI0026F06034|nr:hypothetical protein [Aminicella lysinilytica]